MSNAMPIRRARIRGNEWMLYKTVGLGISVGKPAHEGADLEAAIEMIGELQKPCIIRLSDTLQRHNLMAEGMGVKEAWVKSKEMGNEWRQRNIGTLERLPFRPTIIRWDDVINDPDFEDVLASFVQISFSNRLFAETLKSDVTRFLSRRIFNSHTEETIFAECSRAFLLEELAGQTILGRHYSYAGFYPGKAADILQIVHAGEISNAPQGLENTAFIRFTLESRVQPKIENELLLRHSL